MSITINLSGKIDTAGAVDAEKHIELCLRENNATPQDKIIIDCKDLAYISSTGLRIVLKYKKLYPELEVINTSGDVYDVFEITGFSRIMPVKKALREISIAQCKEIARGGVGIIYRYDEDTIIKVFSASCDISIPEQERDMARESFVLGMPTAIPYDIVWVTETQSYGMMTELINAKTLGATINENLDNYKYYAKLYGRMMRDMHKIKVEAGTLPDSVDVHLAQLDRIAPNFQPEHIELLKYLISKIPRGNSLLHNDCHPKNVMLLGEKGHEELLLIDMGEVSYGNPLFELMHAGSTFHMYQNFEGIVGFSEEYMTPFWIEAIKAYFDIDDDQKAKEYEEVIEAASIIRHISWLALSNYPKEVIDDVRTNRVEKQLWKNKDYYIAMAEKFKDYFPGN